MIGNKRPGEELDQWDQNYQFQQQEGVNEPERKKGRRKGFIWSHVETDPDGKVHCKYCHELIKINFGEKVERVRKHFIKQCKNSPFVKNSREYEEILECINWKPQEQKKLRKLKKKKAPSATLGKAKSSNKVICHSINAVTSIIAGDTSYAELTAEQVQQLEAQGNRSSNWSSVKLMCPTGVSYDLSLDKIRGCQFSGNVYLGLFVKNTTLRLGGVEGAVVSVMSGLYNSSFSGNCVLCDNCYVSNTTMLMNVFVGRNSCIVGCGMIVGDGRSGYGTLKTITIGPEVPIPGMLPRKVSFHVNSTYADVCKKAMKPEKESVISAFGASTMSNQGLPGMGMEEMGMSSAADALEQKYNKKAIKFNRSDDNIRYEMTIICDDVEIVRCGRIRNCYIGNYCILSGSDLDTNALLSHATITSSSLKESMLHETTYITGDCSVSGVLMFPNASISDRALVSDSILGPDASVSVGECRHSLVGPFLGFNHQSLLISSCWPLGRGYMEYGAMLGANHTARSNDQECFPGEGVFFGLGCVIKFPFCTLGSPFSIVAPGTVCLPQKLSFPFSMISPPEDQFPAVAGLSPALSSLKPGWVLINNPYFLEKAFSKPTGHKIMQQGFRTDCSVLRPSVMDLVLVARSRLQRFKETQQPEALSRLLLTEKDIEGLGKCVVRGQELDAAIEAYTHLLHRYALHGLLFMIATMGEPLPIFRPNAHLTGDENEENQGVPSFLMQDDGLDDEDFYNSAAIGGSSAILKDIRLLETGIPSVEDFLLQGGELRPSMQRPPGAMGRPPKRKPVEITLPVNPAAIDENSEVPISKSLIFLGQINTSGETPGAGCCVLTDTHLGVVRRHQLKVLREEFPQVEIQDFVQGNAPAAAPKVKQLFGYLLELEQAYVNKVVECREKDVSNCSSILPDFPSDSGTGLATDLLIERARWRLAHLQRVVGQLMP